MEDFIKKDIWEMCKICNLDFEDVYTCYLNTELNIESLKKIKDVSIRSAVYESLVLYEKRIFESGLTEDIKEVLGKIHDTREKGYLSEKKTILKIKILFKMLNGDNYDFLYQKLSYIIGRRLFYVYNGNIECEQTNEVELSLLLQQIVTDIMSYLNMLQIYNRARYDFNENYIKSFILRILKTMEAESDKIELVLKKINGKTIYFIRSSYNKKLFFHFYARAFLSEPKVIYWKNIGLNGGYHYLNKRRVIEPNIHNYYNNFTENLISFVEKQNKIKFFIDKKMIEIQRDRVIKQLNKDKTINREWGEYFAEIKDLGDRDLNEIINLEIYKKKIKKNQYVKKINNVEELEKIKDVLKQNTSESRKKKLEAKKAYLEKLIEKNILIFDPKYHNKWIQKDFSYSFLIKIYLEYLEFFEKYEEPLHFSLYFDFRGRNYFNSMVAPSQGWPFRFLYYFEDDEPSKKDNLIDTNLYEKEINEVEKKIGNLNTDCKRSLVWVLLSIGSITIKKKDEISEDEFIKEGLKSYVERVKVDDNLENSELEYYYLIIDNYNNDKKNRYVLKDISGSIFQNASIILGIKNENVMKLLNIDNKKWNDPYAPLVKRIKDVVKEELKIFFNRKTLKKPIMTKYYNAKIIKSFEYFIVEAKKVDGYNDILFKDLWREFQKIYKVLVNLEKELIYENSNEDYNKFLIKEKVDVVDFECMEFSILSYELKSTRIDIVVNGKRITTTTYRPTKKVYRQKTNNSMIPNIFHGEDSYRARMLINNFNSNCFSIHDAFGISHLKINELILSANETFDVNKKRKFYMSNNRVERKLFSKFIIL